MSVYIYVCVYIHRPNKPINAKYNEFPLHIMERMNLYVSNKLS